MCDQHLKVLAQTLHRTTYGTWQVFCEGKPFWAMLCNVDHKLQRIFPKLCGKP